MDELVSKQAVLKILETLLEQANEVAACGANPTAEEALVRAIDDVSLIPTAAHSS